MREEWRGVFEEIREGISEVDYDVHHDAIVVVDDDDDDDANSVSIDDSNDGKGSKELPLQSSDSKPRKRGLNLLRWKEVTSTTSSNTSNNNKTFKTRRLDAFTAWEKQLQQWSEEVTTYIHAQQNTATNTTTSWGELLLKSRERGRYDLGRFGVVEDEVSTISSSSTEEQGASSTVNGFSATTTEGALDGDDVTEQSNSRESSTSTTFKKRQFGLNNSNEATTKTTSRSLPIALTALEPNLPDLPKPRPILPGEAIVPHTDISDLSKRIWIVTTAALPWMTGTAVNPLLRAAYLCSGRKEKGGSVTLLLPWVERPADHEKIYGSQQRFTTPKEQEAYIRNWLQNEANLSEASTHLNIEWYTAWLEPAENSLYSMGTLIELIPPQSCDICILEEPEHLNWYRAPGENWTEKFAHVVGIVHTNYFVYAQEQPAAFIRAPGMQLLCQWMCRAHCHRLVKLSGTLGKFAPEKELVENVHGVRSAFLEIGRELGGQLRRGEGGVVGEVFGPEAEVKVYFIGKMLWSKGLGSLMDLMRYAEESAGLKVTVDMYGGGPNKEEASEKASSMGLDMPFHGPVDHAELGFSHKIFVNPSLSEVLCTTVAEALAMGKFVVLPNHPSNDFFAQFPNCLPYSNKEEFVGEYIPYLAFIELKCCMKTIVH